MKAMKTYQVKELAALTGVTVRALHHYDAIGLLPPAGRTAAGYRLYDKASLYRLQQILIRRELGFSLEDIKASLDSPDYDLKTALKEQRQMLEARQQRGKEMLGAIAAALNGLEEITMNEKGAMFKGFNPEDYADEVKEKWGETDAYKESSEKQREYSKSDYSELSKMQAALYQELAQLKEAGASADDAAIQDVVERHRLFINDHFYACSVEMHKGLADMYRADERFQQSIDQAGAGTALFLADAIDISAR